MRAILSSDGPRPSAVVCGNDYLAIGALLEAQAMGLLVPQDLSITGFDDVAIAAQITPPLTTMRVPNHKIGQLAADYLLTRLGGSAGGPPVPVLAPDFVERRSTAPPS